MAKLTSNQENVHFNHNERQLDTHKIGKTQKLS